MLEEKRKVLQWVVDKVFSQDYVENELLELEKKLKEKRLSESEKQILCGQAERLIEKLDEICAEALRIAKTKLVKMGLRISVMLEVTFKT